MQITSSTVFDRDRILAPISTESPTGELLRYEGTYDYIQDARRQDDPKLAMGIWEHELKEANWNRVCEICTESLEKRTKDLQIAAWLLEAWLHLYDFAGVREGLTTIEELCGAFWKTMYPSLDDPEYRLSIFHWMNEKLSLQLKFIPITNPPQATNALPYCYWDWETAVRAEQNAHQRREARTGAAPGDEEITITKFQQSLLLSPPDFVEALCNDLTSVSSACLSLEAFLDRQYGKAAPSLRAFREIPESIETLIQQITGGHKAPASELAATNGEEASHAESENQPAAAEPQPVTTGPPIRSRAEAYQRLAEAAEYLFRTEPHSPTPYLVRKAISWGNMTLDELLPELVRSESALQETMKLLQVESKKGSTSQRKE